MVPEAQSEDASRQTELVPAGVPVPSLKGNAYPPFPRADQFAGVNARPPLGHEAGTVAVVGEHVEAPSFDAPEEAPLPGLDAEPEETPLVVPEPDPVEAPLVAFDAEPDEAPPFVAPDADLPDAAPLIEADAEPMPDEDPPCSPDVPDGDPDGETGALLHATFATTAAREPKARQERPKRSLRIAHLSL